VARQNGFRAFLTKGNIIDLAVAVVIGTAFTALIKAAVADLLTPLIALIINKPSFGNLAFTVHHTRFLYGDFVDALITFLSVAAAVYYFVVAPAARLAARTAAPAPALRSCPYCTYEIPAAASRCPFCTATVGPSQAG
jgi:large conductance mechanosensitive channel